MACSGISFTAQTKGDLRPERGGLKSIISVVTVLLIHVSQAVNPGICHWISVIVGLWGDAGCRVNHNLTLAKLRKDLELGKLDVEQHSSETLGITNTLSRCANGLGLLCVLFMLK